MGMMKAPACGSMKRAIVSALWLAGCVLLGHGQAWAINLDVNDTRVIFGDDAADDQVKYVDFDATNNSLAPQASGVTAPVRVQSAAGDATSDTTAAQVEWVVEKISPRTGTHLLGIQYIAPGLCGGTATCVHLNFLTRPDSADDTAAATWTPVAGFPKQLADSPAGGNRRFDIAVESKRGRFLVAYQNPADNQQLTYFLLRPDGSVERGQAAVATDAGNAAANWVRLVPHPTTDEVTLLYASGGTLNSFRWNGSAWNPPSPVVVTTSMRVVSEAFAGAYEQQSPYRMLAAYNGTSGTNVDATAFRTSPAGTLSWSSDTLIVGDGSQAVAVAAQPGSHKIVIGAYKNTTDIYPPGIWEQVWDGSLPGGAATCLGNACLVANNFNASALSTNADDQGRVPLAVGWANDCAVVVFADAANSGSSLKWNRWGNCPTLMSWGSSVLNTAGFSTYDKYGWVLEPYADGTKLAMALADKNDQLSTAVFNGTSWAVTGPPLATANLSLHNTGRFYGRPFALANNQFAVPTLTASAASVKVPVTPGTAQDLGLTLTIKDKGGVIYAENPNDGDAITTQDIAIVLPAALTGVVWDKGAVCLGGALSAQVQNSGSTAACASPLVQATATYSADSKTMYLNVTSDFAPSTTNTLTISNLGVSFQAAAAASAAAQPLTVSVNTAVDGDATSDVDLDLTGAPSIQPVESLGLTAPATQVADAFNTTGSVSSVGLLRVALTAKGDDVALSQLAFSQTLTGALTLSGLQIKDEATGAVYPAAGQSGLTFSAIPSNCTTGAFCIPQNQTKTFLLSGSASGLGVGDALTLSLGTGGIKAKGQTSLANLETITGAISGAAVSKTHTVSTYTITAPTGGSVVIAGTPWTISWTSGGLASPNQVVVSYSTDGSTWTPLTCTINYPGSGNAASCATTVPDAITLPPQTAEVKVKDASQPIERISPAFTIGGVTQLTDPGTLNLPGGPTWIIGANHAIAWQQLGSFTALLELSLDGGTTWPTVLGTQDVSALSLTEKAASFSYTVGSADAGNTVKVRVRPNAAASAVGSRVSSVFAVKPAFSNLQPSGGQVLLGQSVNVTWDRLDGTKPGDIFPINSVTVNVLDASRNVLGAMTVANDGSEPWVPAQLMTSGKIRVCDANRSAVCNVGGSFDVIGPAVSLSPLKADYLLGDAVTINWTGGPSGAIALLLVDQAGSPVPNGSIAQVTAAGSSGSYIWAIPANLAVPQANVHVRLQSVASPGVFADSAALAIHGILKNVTVSPTPAKTENAAADASNDVTISWQATGATPVKLWIKRQGDPDYQPLSSFGAGAPADSVSGTSFTWTNILGTAKTPQAQIKATQVGDAAAVFAESAAFAIVGELGVTKPVAGTSVDLNNPAQVPIRFEWTTVRGPVTQVRLRVLDNANVPQPLDGSGTTSLVVANLASPSGYDWTPPTTYPSLRLEACDANSLSICATSPAFSVTGLKVLSPVPAARFVIGQTGVAVPIQWKPVGGHGAVNLLYRIGTGQPISIANAVTSIDNATNTYTWALPVTFANLSDQVVVMIQDTSGAPVNESAPFTIAGALALTGVVPVKATYAVGDAITMAWQRFGGIKDLRLQYCGVNCAAAANWHDGPTLTNVSTPVGSFANWPIPLDAISASLQLRAVDATAGHPAADSTSVTITVTPGLTLTLPDASPWVAGEVHPIHWSTNGLVDQVQLLYSVNGGPFVPMAGTPLANGIVQNTNGDVQWQGSFDWQAVDPNLPHDPLSYAPATVALKVVDASNGHVPVEQISSSLSLIYLKVVWQVMDLTTRNVLGGLNVLETSFSSGTASWQVTDGSIIPNSPNPVGILRYYPIDQYTTTWSRTGSSEPAVVSGWLVNRSKLEDLNGDGLVNPVQDGIVKKAFLELDANQQLPWGVPLRFQYQPGPPAGVLIMGWLEKRGLLQDAQLVQQLDVEIRNGTQAIKTLSSSSPDSAGVFRVTWDLTDNAGNPADPDLAYYAKATVTTATGAALTSGDMLAVGGPKGLTLAQFQAGLQSVTNDLGAVKTATVGPASTLEQVKADTGNIQTVVTALPTQLSATQTAIQSDIATAKTALGTQLDAVQADTTAIKQDTGAIKAETDKISTDVIPGINNVQAYLQDPNAGLPKVHQTLSQHGDQLKAMRRGGILNLDTRVEPGQPATIQYRSEGGVPAMTVYDSAGAAVPAPALALNAATGLYEASIPLSAEGVYRVVVSEPASANSAGTIDSVALTVKASLNQTVATSIDTLTSAVQALEANFNALQATASASQATVNTMQTQTQQLLDKWGTLDGKTVMDTLNGLDTETLMKQMAEVQQAVGSVQGSGTAATFSQGAWAAANQAVELLKAMKQGDGAAGDTQAMLTQLNDKLATVSKAVSSVSSEAVANQLKAVTEQMKTMASDKGYHFDALYDMNKTQATNVQSTRNRVEELKALLDLQQALLQRNLDHPVVKTWFEGR